MYTKSINHLLTCLFTYRVIER